MNQNSNTNSQLNPNSHFGQLMYSYYGTYDLEKIKHIMEQEDNNLKDDINNDNYENSDNQQQNTNKKVKRNPKIFGNGYKLCQILPSFNMSHSNTDVLLHQIRASYGTTMLINQDIQNRLQLDQSDELRNYYKAELEIMNQNRTTISTIVNNANEIFKDKEEGQLTIQQLQSDYENNNADGIQLYFPKQLSIQYHSQQHVQRGQVQLAAILLRQGKRLSRRGLTKKQKDRIRSYLTKTHY